MFIRNLIEVLYRIIVIGLTGPLPDTVWEFPRLILAVTFVIFPQTLFQVIFNNKGLILFCVYENLESKHSC